MATLGQITDIIKHTFGRSTDEIERILPFMLQDTINDICKRNKLPFMQILPDPTFITSFPVSTYTSFKPNDPYSAYWLAKGWLYTASGTAVYSFPREYEASRLLFVDQYDENGVVDLHLRITNAAQFYSNIESTFKSTETGTPETVLLYTDGKQAKIFFQPTPDDAYIYAIGYERSHFPGLINSDDTNDLMELYPNVAVKIGLMVMAQYFGKMDEYQMYYMELYGQDGRGGLVRDMVRNAQSRNVGNYKGFITYKSRGHALGMKSAGHFKADGSGYPNP